MEWGQRRGVTAPTGDPWALPNPPWVPDIFAPSETIPRGVGVLPLPADPGATRRGRPEAAGRGPAERGLARGRV